MILHTGLALVISLSLASRHAELNYSTKLIHRTCFKPRGAIASPSQSSAVKPSYSTCVQQSSALQSQRWDVVHQTNICLSFITYWIFFIFILYFNHITGFSLIEQISESEAVLYGTRARVARSSPPMKKSIGCQRLLTSSDYRSVVLTAGSRGG